MPSPVRPDATGPPGCRCRPLRIDGLQHRVGDYIGQRPGQTRRLEKADRQPAPSRAPSRHPPGDLAARIPAALQSRHIADMTHRKPLRRHPGPLSKAASSSPGDIIPECWARSSRNVGDIKSERWARSFRNSGQYRADCDPEVRARTPSRITLLH
jgi:hypothetical protein